MKSFFSGLLLLIISITSFNDLSAQQQAFYDEIQAFKKVDATSFPPADAILFVGSSSFRKWTNVQADFPDYTIINRGFGGSSFPDVIRYAPDIILPYKPKQVLIYCGDNDLASSDTVTPQIVASRFKKLFNIIRTGLPKTNIAFVSIKPSPSRERLQAKMIETNNLIKAFLKKNKNTAYIDVYNKMLQSDGKAIPSLFVEDKLHMNETGYTIWQTAIKPFLLKK